MEFVWRRQIESEQAASQIITCSKRQTNLQHRDQRRYAVFYCKYTSEDDTEAEYGGLRFQVYFRSKIPEQGNIGHRAACQARQQDNHCKCGDNLQQGINQAKDDKQPPTALYVRLRQKPTLF
jgi:hypothetical protein